MGISFRQELLRKSVHLSSLWMVAALYFLPPLLCGVVFVVMAILNYLLEYAYYRGRGGSVTALYGKIFGKMLRDNHERFRPSGSPPFLLAAGVCAFVFPHPIPAMAMMIMILSDTAAALIGRRFGRHRFANGKSAEGSGAFVVVGLLTLAAWYFAGAFTPAVAIGGACGVLVAAVLELLNEDLHLDDNFSIPLAVGIGASIPLLLF